MDECTKLITTAVLSFASGIAIRWWFDSRSERRGVIKQVVERYVALPEPREGASASLERLAMLQRCGAGLLTQTELSAAASAIRKFGRPDPLDTGVGISAFDLLQDASSRGQTLGSAIETYEWIVSIRVSPSAK